MLGLGPRMRAPFCPEGARVQSRHRYAEQIPMLTLYSYPSLFGVADNNGYGLKVFAFLKLAGVPFRHEHTIDASSAPRNQLPYIVDDGETIGDSDSIIAYAARKSGWTSTTGSRARNGTRISS